MWYALFIVLIATVLMGVLIISQDLSSQDYYEDMLAQSLNEAASSIATMEDVMTMERDMDRGVHITVLNEHNELILGKRSFSVNMQETAMRIRRSSSGSFWYLMDKKVILADDTQIWLRAYMSSQVSERYNHTIMLFSLVAIPLLLLVAVAGGFMLTKRAFQPVDEIIHMAEGISGTTDLKRRFRVDNQEDEVGKLADTFDGMLARLERALEDEKAFISNASHELRTPITVIRAQSEFALNPDRTVEEKDAALKTILARSTTAGQMLSQMLLLSRMDYDKLPLNFERIDLSELVEQIAQEMEIRCEEKGIAIVCDIEENVCNRCDELLMIRMLTNLLENAMQYGRENGHIWLRLCRREDKILITVRDDGIGISEDDQKKIWRRFYQVDKSGELTSGFGLGLSFVQWIVAAHDGKIFVSSTLGKGSCFEVELPDNIQCKQS